MTEQKTITPMFVKLKSQIDSLRSQLAAMTVRAERAEAVVEKLPLTADRVRVVPMTDPVYLRLDDGQVVQMTVWANGNCAPRNKAYEGTWTVSQCYSSREAAEAAREQGVG